MSKDHKIHTEFRRSFLESSARQMEITPASHPVLNVSGQSETKLEAGRFLIRRVRIRKHFEGSPSGVHLHFRLNGRLYGDWAIIAPYESIPEEPPLFMIEPGELVLTGNSSVSFDVAIDGEEVREL